MRIKSRKLYVWLISLGAVFAIYLLYSQISKTPPIEIDTGAKFADTVAESNTSDFENEIGMVGEVGVGTVQKAKYTHLNAEKQVDREFGFEKLLHAEGDEWEIEKPYMNVFRHDLKCYMTADKGKVQVEEAVGKATPKDATLTGNVVIHILPEKGSNIKESFIYLDDVIFISEKSQFSTAGPVKFTSQDAQMLGKGLELVYNDELDRLEFLKIIDLDTLRLRQSSLAPESSDARQGNGAEETALSAASEDRKKAKKIPAVDRGTIEKKKGKSRLSEVRGEYYRCIFRNNVIIDCPEQLIFADEVSVNNLLWAKAPDKKYENRDTGSADKMKTAVEITEEGATSPRNEPNELSEQFIDIVVTCDGGILVVPMDSSGAIRNYAKPEPEATVTGGKGLKNFGDPNGRATFEARRIDYCPISDEVTLEGDCLCATLREKPNFQQKYTLSAPKIAVKLSRDKDKQPSALAPNIEHLTASGEVVQLDTSKWAGEELLGFTKLKCLKFDYDTGWQMFSATGPGIIAVDNSKIAEPEGEVGRFSLQRPCYAVVRNFDTLKYFSETNLIVADSEVEQILIDYFPIVQGKYGQQVSATTSHIEAFLYETAGGRSELSTLSATGGITYEEEGKKKNWWGKRKDIQFVGSELFYDANKSIITAWGDELQPCFLNGALVPSIEYNLKTDKIKTKITSPGMLQMER